MQDFCRKTKRQVFRGNSNEDDYDEALDDTILGTFFQPASIRTLLDFLITSLRHFCWELLNERSFLILDRHCLDIFNFCCLLFNIEYFLSEFTFLSARCQLISSPQELFFFSRSLRGLACSKKSNMDVELHFSACPRCPCSNSVLEK